MTNVSVQELVPGQAPKLQRNPVSKNKTKQNKTSPLMSPPSASFNMYCGENIVPCLT